MGLDEPGLFPYFYRFYKFLFVIFLLLFRNTV